VDTWDTGRCTSAPTRPSSAMACTTREAFFCRRRVWLCGRKLHFVCTWWQASHAVFPFRTMQGSRRSLHLSHATNDMNKRRRVEHFIRTS
jgi:hypothetical protein